MVHTSTEHEVLTAVFQVGGLDRRRPRLNVLLWQRAREPQLGRWSLPGGLLRNDEDVTASARRQLAEKVDLREIAHLEQLAVFSDPGRVPGVRTIASTFLGLVPSPADPELPDDTHWHPVDDLPDGVRPRNHGVACPQPAGRQDVLYEHRVRFGANRIRALNTS